MSDFEFKYNGNQAIEKKNQKDNRRENNESSSSEAKETEMYRKIKDSSDIKSIQKVRLI